MRLLRDTRLMTTLTAIAGSEVGRAERQLYRAIAAMTLGLHNSLQLWGAGWYNNTLQGKMLERASSF